MKYIKISVLTLILFSSSFFARAQKIQLEGFGGHSYYIDKNADGYDLGIGINYVISKKSKIGLSIGHSFNDFSPLPSNLTDAKIILKEESFRLPLGLGEQRWEEDGVWPKIRLEEQPNRYFRFNMGVHYSFLIPLKNQNRFHLTLGGILSYRDESELIKFVKTRKISGIFVKPTFDHSIPIFSYNTYIDAGFQFDFTCLYIKIRSLNIGYRLSLILYPKSGDFMINNGLIISLKP